MSIRFRAGDVTETLVRATEKVSEMNPTHAMVLLYSCPPELTAPAKLKVICSDAVTIETANWMLDQGKNFLLNGD
jgi:hypothetical protein